MIFVVLSLILSCSKSSNSSIRILNANNKEELKKEIEKINWVQKLESKNQETSLSEQELTENVEINFLDKGKEQTLSLTPQILAIRNLSSNTYDKEKMINILQDTKDWTHVYNAISKMSKSDDTLKGSKDLFVNFLYNRCYGLIEIMVKEKAISKLKLKTSDIDFACAIKRVLFYKEYLGDSIKKLKDSDFRKLLETLSYVADNLEYDKEESAKKTKQEYFLSIFQELMFEEGKTINNNNRQNYKIACEELIDMLGDEKLLNKVDKDDLFSSNFDNNIDYLLKVLQDDELYNDKIKTFISSYHFMESVKERIYIDNSVQTPVEIMLYIIKEKNPQEEKSKWYDYLNKMKMNYN